MGGVLSASPLKTTMPFSTTDCLPSNPSPDLPPPVLPGNMLPLIASTPLLREGVR